MEKEKYRCQCCGYKTLEEPSGHYDICPVCFWEDDPFQLLDPECSKGANHISLKEAKVNYSEFGACEREMLIHVRKPLMEER